MGALGEKTTQGGVVYWAKNEKGRLRRSEAK
jgi:hypothetical protein